jgi:MFS family permease
LTLALFAGALADRYDRVRIFTLIQFLSALPVCVMVLLYYFGLLAVWHLIVLEIVVSVVKSASPSATQSLIRELAPEKQIMNAVALSSMGFNAARVIGPSVGGLLILWLGVGGCFALDALVLVVAGLEMLLIRRRARKVESSRQNFMGEIKVGLQYIGRAPTIIAILGVAYTTSVLVGTYQRFLPIFAKDILDVGPEGLGYMVSAPGVGAILTLFFLASGEDRGDRKKLLWVMAILSPLAVVLFCMARSLWLGLFLLGLVGAGQVGFRTVARVAIQYDVPAELLGRVISVFSIERGLNSVGSVVLGAFIAVLGAGLGLASAGALALGIMFTLYAFLKPRRASLQQSS